jgi:hypothetical protein
MKNTYKYFYFFLQLFFVFHHPTSQYSSQFLSFIISFSSIRSIYFKKTSLVYLFSRMKRAREEKEEEEKEREQSNSSSISSQNYVVGPAMPPPKKKKKKSILFFFLLPFPFCHYRYSTK